MDEEWVVIEPLPLHNKGADAALPETIVVISKA